LSDIDIDVDAKMVDVLNNCVPEISSGNLETLLEGMNFNEVETLLDGISNFQIFREEHLSQAQTESRTIKELSEQYAKFLSGENPNTSEITAEISTLNSSIACSN